MAAGRGLVREARQLASRWAVEAATLDAVAERVLVQRAQSFVVQDALRLLLVCREPIASCEVRRQRPKFLTRLRIPPHQRRTSLDTLPTQSRATLSPTEPKMWQIRRALASRALLPVVAFMATSCARGLRYEPVVTLPTPEALSGVRSVVVSGFLASERETSITHSEVIEETLESVNVHDISSEIASGLRERGIRAEARVGFRPSGLQPGQVLIRGAIMKRRNTDRTNPAGLFTDFVLLFGTGGIVGLILPSPITMSPTQEYSYRAEVIDADGRIRMQSGQRETAGIYQTNYIASTLSTADVLQGVKRQLLNEVAAGLKATAATSSRMP